MSRLSLRHRLSHAWARLVHRYEAVQYDLGLWKSAGGALPHAVKERIVLEHARRFGLTTFIETGTHIGHMVAATVNHFDHIHSIELGRHLYERASSRFAGKKNVHLYCGDSAALLSPIIAALRGPALFWLDAHYSGGITVRGNVDTPIVAELQRILGNDRRPHVVLIDDARSFRGSNGYPTPEELGRLLAGIRPDYEMAIVEDVIRLVPKQAV